MPGTPESNNSTPTQWNPDQKFISIPDTLTFVNYGLEGDKLTLLPQDNPTNTAISETPAYPPVRPESMDAEYQSRSIEPRKVMDGYRSRPSNHTPEASQLRHHSTWPTGPEYTHGHKGDQTHRPYENEQPDLQETYSRTLFYRTSLVVKNGLTA